MPDYALLIGGTFKQVVRLPEKPENIPHKGVSWHEVVEEQGLSAFTGLVDGQWVIRTALPTVADLKAQKLAELADLRWRKETGGTVFNGMSIATDATSQTKYIGAVVGAQMDPNTTIKWKLANGDFVTLDAAAIVGVAMAVRSHVQACFDNEANLRVLIEAAEDQAELDAIDLNAGWPA